MNWTVSLELDPVPDGLADAAASLGGAADGPLAVLPVTVSGPVAAAEAVRLAQTRLSTALRAAGGEPVTSASVVRAAAERAPAPA